MKKPIMTYALWIAQGLLALVFLFAGGIKLVLPLEVMTEQMPLPLPGEFLRFIGVAEVLGAIGLIPLAASGLVIIMTGATALTVAGGDVGSALIPLVVGLLSVFVAYGRGRLGAHHGDFGDHDADAGRAYISTGY